MAAKDLFHGAVRRGLEKDQWIVTDDPLELEWEEVSRFSQGETLRERSKSKVKSEPVRWTGSPA